MIAMNPPKDYVIGISMVEFSNKLQSISAALTAWLNKHQVTPIQSSYVQMHAQWDFLKIAILT